MPSSPRVFDAHLHIIDPRFPLVASDGYLPPEFTAAHYLEHAPALGIAGGAVVSGSFQAFDQGYLLDALAALGPGFVGVTQLPPTTPDARILELDAAGVRAVRFNARRGGSAELADLDRFARRVHELAGWHTELYIDARDLVEIESTVSALPAVSVDHLGLRAEGLPTLLRLVERGLRVKATGFGRVDLDPEAALASIHRANPAALVFGTDLPSTRARRPFEAADLELVRRVAGERALWRNAAEFYRI